MSKNKFGIIGITLCIVLLFFYQIFQSKLPFPGDLLVGQAPYSSNTYGGYAPGAVPNKAQGPDVIAQLFPWKYFAIESIKQGYLPFWNPHQFSGNPLLANFQSGVFYPLNIVFLLPFLPAWTLFIILISVLAIVFMYGFLRELAVSRAGSLYGGIVFAFSSYMVVWMEYGNIGHTLLWLPLILYLTERLQKKASVWLVAVFEAVLVCSFLAGYIQGFFYAICLAFCYYVVRKVTTHSFSFRKAALFGVLLLLPLLLCAFQLLPTIELFEHSSRGNYSLPQIQKLLNPVYYAITVIVPDFFGNPASRNYWFNGTYIERVSYFGLIPFVLALCGALFSRKKSSLFFSIVAGITFLAATDLIVNRYFFQIPIPVLSTTVPTRLLSLFVFSGSILSSFGFDEVITKSKKKIIIPSIITLAVLILIWISIVGLKLGNLSPENVAVAKHNLILPTIFAMCAVGLSLVAVFSFRRTGGKIKRYSLIAIVFLLTIADLFYFFQKITPFSPKEYVYPATPVISYLQKNAGIDRFWGYGSAYIASNYQSVDGTYSPDGNDPLHLKDYTEFISTSDDGKLPPVISRTDANIAPGYGTGDLNGNPFRQKILNVLGVKYVLHKYDVSSPDLATFADSNYKLVWQQGSWQVYQNLAVAPRYFLTNSYTVVSSEKALINRFYDPDFNERTDIILSQNPQIPKGKGSVGHVQLLSYLPNKVTFRTETDAPSLLFLSDTFYSDWQAKVDDTQSTILKADGVLRAVVVPSGNHMVTFIYRSKSFEYGVLIGSSTLLAMIIVLYLLRKKTLYELL